MCNDKNKDKKESKAGRSTIFPEGQTARQTGRASTMKEMQQLDDRQVYYAVDVNDLTAQERKRVMESLLFLVENRD